MPQPETLWLVYGGQRVALTGHVAAVVTELLHHQDTINGFDRGVLRVTFGNGPAMVNLQDVPLPKRPTPQLQAA